MKTDRSQDPPIPVFVAARPRLPSRPCGPRPPDRATEFPIPKGLANPARHLSVTSGSRPKSLIRRSFTPAYPSPSGCPASSAKHESLLRFAFGLRACRAPLRLPLAVIKGSQTPPSRASMKQCSMKISCGGNRGFPVSARRFRAVDQGLGGKCGLLRFRDVFLHLQRDFSP